MDDAWYLRLVVLRDWPQDAITLHPQSISQADRTQGNADDSTVAIHQALIISFDRLSSSALHLMPCIVKNL